MGLPLLLAQDALGPTAIGETLGKAQDVQEILGVIVGVLIVVVLALVGWYLRERKAWGEEKVAIVVKCAEDEKALIGRWTESKIKWEQERHAHTAQLGKVREAAADVERGLMREMMGLSLRIEQALTKLAEWKDARD